MHRPAPGLGPEAGAAVVGDPGWVLVGGKACPWACVAEASACLAGGPCGAEGAAQLAWALKAAHASDLAGTSGVDRAPALSVSFTT